MDFKRHIKTEGVQLARKGAIGKYFYKGDYYIVNDLLNYNVKGISLEEFNSGYVKAYEIDLFMYLFCKLIEKEKRKKNAKRRG